MPLLYFGDQIICKRVAEGAVAKYNPRTAFLILCCRESQPFQLRRQLLHAANRRTVPNAQTSAPRA